MDPEAETIDVKTNGGGGNERWERRNRSGRTRMGIID